MRAKYTITLTIISIMLVASLSLGGTFLIRKPSLAFPLDNNTDTIVVANGDLSINYLNGANYNVSYLTNEEYIKNISITNTGNNEITYFIKLSNIYTDVSNKEDITYSLESSVASEGYIDKQINNADIDIIDNVTIAPGNTVTYKLIVHYNKSEQSKVFTADILIGTEKKKEETFSDRILASSNIGEVVNVSSLGSIASVDEGLIKSNDNDGTVYYYRGNIANNYVSFAGLLWRIVKINGNGSIKLVLNGTVSDSSSQFLAETGSGTVSSFTGISGSAIENFLSSWYQAKLFDYDDYIVNSSFCLGNTDINNTANNYNYFNNYANVINTNITNSCNDTKTIAKIGLLTASDVLFAGGSFNNTNNSYYLYNPDIKANYWTMTPAKIYKTTNSYIFEVNTNGALIDTGKSSDYKAIRPVINVISNIDVTGTGLSNDPYVIK